MQKYIYGKWGDLLKAAGAFLRDTVYPEGAVCSCCGKIKDDLTLADRIYVCSCGSRMDRDLNAAINIKMEAMRLIAS